MSPVYAPLFIFIQCNTPNGTTSCPAGQYLTATGYSSTQTLTFGCSPCPAGFACAGGLGAIAISTTTMTFSQCYQAGFAPISGGGCGRPLWSGASMSSQIGFILFSCPAGSFYVQQTGCAPCPAAALRCVGGFAEPDFPSQGGVAAPSASSTPTPTPSASSSPAPPAQQDVLIAYSLNSSALCAANDTASRFLDPSTGIAPAMRYTFASSLAFNVSRTFISGLIVCDSQYIPVARTAPINTAQVGDIAGVTEDMPSTRRRMLLSASLRMLQASSSTTLGQLNLNLDGQTIIVELGVMIPQMLAPAMASLLTASLAGDANAVRAVAANITAIMSSPAYLAAFPPGSYASNFSALPAPLVSAITAAASSGSVQGTESLETVVADAAPAILTAFGLPPGTNLSSTIVAQSVRLGTVTVYPQLLPPSSGGGAPAEDASSGSSGLGALVLIPLAFIGCAVYYFFFIVPKRKREAEKKKALDSDEFAPVVTTFSAPGPSSSDKDTDPDGGVAVAGGGKALVIRSTAVKVSHGPVAV